MSSIAVCLVNPWTHDQPGPDEPGLPPASDCLGMGYIAAVLREAGFSVATFDAYVLPMTAEQVARRIVRRARGGRPLVVGFSFMGPLQLEPAAEVIRRLRAAGVNLIHVTAGGQFASTCHASLLRHFPDTFDSIVYGEGEETARELFDCLAKGGDWRAVRGVSSAAPDGSLRFERRAENPDLEVLPRASRDSARVLRRKRGVANVDSSRGCESHCTFCMSREILRDTPSKLRWRSRAPGDVAGEIEWLAKEKRIKRFNLTDENTMGNRSHRQRLVELADELIARKLDVGFSAYFRAQDVDAELLEHLRRAGLIAAFVGIESFWQPTLDRFKKGIDASENVRALREFRKVPGVRLYFGMMMFHPWVSMEEILHNLGMMREEVLGLRLTGPELLKRLVQVLHIYKGTPVYALAKRDGLILGEPPFDQWLCEYGLPDAPRRLLDFAVTSFGGLMKIQNELLLLASDENNLSNARLQEEIHAVNTRIETAVLDAATGYAVALTLGTRGKALAALKLETLRRMRELADSLTGALPGSVSAKPPVRPVDQTDADFLCQVERVAAVAREV